MRFVVLAIEPDDDRVTAELSREDVHHRVDALIDGEPHSFDIELQANVGDDGIHLISPELDFGRRLRFHPGVYRSVIRMVGRVRRGEPVDLPCDLSHMAGVADPSPAASL